ncbi:transposase [Erythrobacter sp. KMU-140]|uniref:Transposase n=1 Tax=Erythrobacter rubeus TaxID=2760803 RepID=A0ABR8KS55_9SPHN|nr:transposase [Erythrobacter rubeus]
MTNSVFDRTRVPLRLWLYAMLTIANSAEGIASENLARQLSVSRPTSLRMLTRIKYHLAALDAKVRLGHASRPVLCRVITSRRIQNNQRNTRNIARILIFADGTSIRTSVIFRPKRSDILALIKSNIVDGALLFTDCYWTSRTLSAYGTAKPLAHHVPNGLEHLHFHGDPISGFASYFRQSFFDQYRGVTLEKFWLYLKEYEFRFNRRRTSSATFWDMISEFPDLADRDRRQLKDSCSRVNLRDDLN